MYPVWHVVVPQYSTVVALWDHTILWGDHYKHYKIIRDMVLFYITTPRFSLWHSVAPYYSTETIPDIILFILFLLILCRSIWVHH